MLPIHFSTHDHEREQDRDSYPLHEAAPSALDEVGDRTHHLKREELSKSSLLSVSFSRPPCLHPQHSILSPVRSNSRSFLKSRRTISAHLLGPRNASTKLQHRFSGVTLNSTKKATMNPYTSSKFLPQRETQRADLITPSRNGETGKAHV